MTPDADTLAAHLATTTTTITGFLDLRFDRLSAAGRIDALLAAEHAVRCAEALRVRALAALDQAAHAEPENERGMTESEVMAAIRWPINTTKSKLAEAGE
ncbi:MAG TPA: hypothetical protein VFU73_06480, partial [Actinocrinis sp.]|nr:hypothetical protein [Actinocrinis sp.]